MELLFGLFGLVIFGAFIFATVRKAHRIDNEGITTDAEVSRVEDSTPVGSPGSSFITYVTYYAEKGEIHESPMTLTSVVEHEEGEKLRIRYIPGKYDMVREVREK